MVRLAVVSLLLGVVHASAQSLPAIPSFEVEPSEPGFVNVQELHARRAKYLGTEVKVRGYVTWIYDCLAAVAKRGESRAKTQRRIDDDPTLCERKKFYLGSTTNTPPEHALSVVDVPRPPNKLERERERAKSDLEAFMKSNPEGFAKLQAERMLSSIP